MSTIQKTESPLTQFEFTEHIDIIKVNELLNSHTFYQYSTQKDQSKRELYASYTIHKRYNGKKENIVNLYDFVRSLNQSFLRVKYHLKPHGWGRHYSQGPSLGKLPRPIRHFLCESSLVDIDIVNCGPAIISQRCLIDGVKCPHLCDYVTNRNRWFDEITSTYGVDKEAAKKLCTRLMFGGSFTAWLKENNIGNITELLSLRNFATELQNIRSIYIQYNKTICQATAREVNCDNAKWNMDGKYFAYLYQTLERMVLDTMITYIQNKYHPETLVLCYDGFMMSKNVFQECVLGELEAEVEKSHGYVLKIIVKNMDEAVVIDRNNEISVNIQDDDGDYKLAKAEFEKDCVVINTPAVFARKHDEIWSLINEPTLKHIYRSKKYKDYNGRAQAFLPKWLNDDSRRSCETCEWNPNTITDVDGVLNLCGGFKHQKWESDTGLEDVDISFVYEHIQNLCGGKESELNWFLDWLACKFQKPWERIHVVPIFYAPAGKELGEGIGKTEIIKWFACGVFGREYYREIQTPQLFDNFNASLERCLFVAWNEPENNMLTGNKPALNQLVTDDFMAVNQKYLPVRDNVKIYYQLIITTNSRLMLANEGRRWKLFKCNYHKMNPLMNEEYANKVINTFCDDNGGYKLSTLRKFCDDLRKRDISKCNSLYWRMSVKGAQCFLYDE